MYIPHIWSRNEYDDQRAYENTMAAGATGGSGCQRNSEIVSGKVVSGLTLSATAALVGHFGI